MTAFPVPAREGRAPVIGWYGDDFTGATDTLATLAHAGLRAMLFLRVPAQDELAAAGALDAVGIAGAARAMSVPAMREELAPVGAFFRDLGVSVLHYKMCSTFDSAPDKGNLCTAIRTLGAYVESPFVPVVGGQPNLGRYCVFSHLYAQAGAHGQVYRIDRHPTMSRHPVTPMGESDLRLHMQAQGVESMGSMHYPEYAQSEEAQDASLTAQRNRLAEGGQGQQPVLFDVAHEAHLAHVGRMIWREAERRMLLAVGASSVARSLLAHWGCAGKEETRAPGPAQGPVFVFAGSLSPVTLGQVRAATAYRHVAVDGALLLDDAAYRSRKLDEVTALLRSGENALACTNLSGAVDTSRAPLVARISADFVAQVVGRMAGIAPLRRVGIAGGDTSSQVTRALDVWGLSYLCSVSPGVTLSRVHSHDRQLDGMELMLKGGQVGSEDLFNRFAARA